MPPSVSLYSASFTGYLAELRETVRLGLPIIVGQLGMVLMGVAATVQVGRLGPAAIAAATLVNSAFLLTSILGLGSVLVLGPQTAAARVRGDYAQCRRLLDCALRLGGWWGAGTAAVFAGVCAWGLPWLRPSAEVLALAPAYGYAVGVSAVPMMLFAALRQFTDGLSFTRVSMAMTLGGLLLDVFLNWVLINGRLGLPAWGLAGAGVAMLLSRTVMAAALCLYVWRGRVFRSFVRVQYPGSPGPLLGRLLRLGVPGGLQFFFEIGAFASATVFAGWLGTVQQAAHGIALNLIGVTYMVAAGIGSAGAIRVGRAVGLGSRLHVVRAGTVAVAVVAVFMGCACVLFLVAAGPLTRLYAAEPGLLATAASLLVVGAFFQLSDGLQVAGLGILRGIADVRVPTWITLVAYWLLGLPAAYVLAFPLGFGVQGVWYGLSLGLSVSAVLLLARFYRLASAPDFVFRHGPGDVSDAVPHA